MNKKIKIKEKSKEIVEQELSEFVSLQETYRGKFIEASYKKIEMDEVLIQITSGNITIKWSGIPMPEKLAKAYLNLLLFNFKQLAKDVETKKSKLRTKGMTEEQLVNLIENDKYVTKIK